MKFVPIVVAALLLVTSVAVAKEAVSTDDDKTAYLTNQLGEGLSLRHFARRMADQYTLVAIGEIHTDLSLDVTNKLISLFNRYVNEHVEKCAFFELAPSDACLLDPECRSQTTNSYLAKVSLIANEARKLGWSVFAVDSGADEAKANGIRDRRKKMDLRDERMAEEIQRRIENQCGFAIHFGGLGHIAKDLRRDEDYQNRSNLTDQLRSRGFQDYVEVGLYSKKRLMKEYSDLSLSSRPRVIRLEGAPEEIIYPVGIDLDYLILF